MVTGGSGGKSTTTTNKEINVNTQYEITIGGGGGGGLPALSGGTGPTKGGNTTAFGITASGGSGSAVNNISYEFNGTTGKTYGKAATGGEANSGNGGKGATVGANYGCGYAGCSSLSILVCEFFIHNI